MTVLGADGRHRCFGGAAGQEDYGAYHDEEWGVPVYDDRLLFEMLILEGAQAGLNWLTVLRKRDGYRRVFHNFDVARVAAMTDAELAVALADPGIVRNKLKVAATRKNARVFLDVQADCGSFSAYLWDYVDGSPLVAKWPGVADMPVSTPISDAISKDLKKRGMTFVGSTIIYAYMQAVGLVDDHVDGCWRRATPQA